MNLTDFFDAYARQARLYPAVLTLAPLALVVNTPPIGEISGYAVTALVVLASLYGMTHWVRALGKRAECRLLREWGGLPTTHYLRWRDTRLDPSTKRRYYTFLRTQGLVMPTAEQEAANPARAEEQLRSATTWLRNNRRGEQFALLHAENASYGFRRNLYGAKPIGVSVTIGVAVAILWRTVGAALPLPAPGLAEIAKVIDTETLTKLLLCLVCLVAWILVVTRNWVESAAHLYARALLETCDTMSG